VDHGDARAHRALAGDEAALSGYESRLADFDAGDVGDGVKRSGGPADERHEAELARARLVGGACRCRTGGQRGEQHGEVELQGSPR
jgi:hypothetical protein